MRILLLVLPLATAACAPGATFGPTPLVPLGPLLSQADALPAAPGFVPALRAEAQDLAARAAAIPDPVGPVLSGPAPAVPANPADPNLASRLAALEARAQALRAQGLTEAERERLGQDPAASLP